MSGAGPALPIINLSEAQAYLRIETGEEEALLAGLIRSASGLCEAFINQLVITRAFAAMVAPTAEWQRLAVGPVRSITDVSSLDAAGAATPLPSASYQLDIDSTGDGWVRVSPSQLLSSTVVTANACGTGALDPSDGSPLASQVTGVPRLQVSGTAGIADGENDVPEAIRQGVLRLVAHLFTDRDGDGGEPPAAVTALWRPYRRLRLA
jgi:hypothetical protein